MAVSTPAAFNHAPTFDNLLKLAKARPNDAAAVVSTIAQGLQGSALSAAQKAELAELTQASNAERLELLRTSTLFKAIFPEGEAADFAACVAAIDRPDSLTWSAGEPPPQVAFTGTVTRNEAGDEYKLKTAGREYVLVGSDRAQKIQPPLSAAWLEGFLHDGEQPITVRGTLSKDGKSVRVEEYSPGTHPSFIFGRARVVHPDGVVVERMNAAPTKAERARIVEAGRVYILTARGEVEVTHKGFKAMLANVPRLGVIIPGSPTVTADGKLELAEQPEFFYALGGRFASNANSPATEVSPGVFETQGDFAYSTFRGPVRAPGEAAQFRFEHGKRARGWLGGAFGVDAEGAVTHFDATYVSMDLGEYSLGDVSSPEGTAAQTLLASAEVSKQGDPQDFVRAMSPPPPAA